MFFLLIFLLPALFLDPLFYKRPSIRNQILNDQKIINHSIDHTQLKKLLKNPFYGDRVVMILFDNLASIICKIDVDKY